MFSIVIATHDSERALVPTLTALVPGATAGIVREVIVTDGGSTDKTEEVAEIAGCHFVKPSGTLGARLAAAAKDARGEWLMFLRPGAVPGHTWIDEVLAFSEREVQRVRAAVFATEPSLFGLFRRGILLPRADQGLILRATLYRELGGHRADASDPEGRLLRKIGRGRIARLRTMVSFPDI